MKKIILLLTVILCGVSSAQSPQGINYQATIRSNTGNLLINQNTNVRFTIHQGSATGQSVYAEQHNTITDDLGAIKLILGQGISLAGNFNEINWGLGNYHLEIEVNTGAGFITLGTTQLMSVPYALYAESSGRVFSLNVVQKTNFYWNDLNGNGLEDDGEIGEYKYLEVERYLIPGDDENFIEEGYVIGVSPNIDINNNIFNHGPGYSWQQFSQNNGMQLNTTYYIRGWAKRSDNTYVYGKPKIVITTP